MNRLFFLLFFVLLLVGCNEVQPAAEDVELMSSEITDVSIERIVHVDPISIQNNGVSYVARVPVIENKTIYTEDSVTHCVGKQCTMTVSPGQQYAIEEGEWKHLRDLKSWKNTRYKCEVTPDGSHRAECLDYNASSIKLRLGIDKSKERRKAIPVKTYDAEGIEKVEKRKLSKRFQNKGDAEIMILDIEPGEEIHFGQTSTTISYITNDSLNDIECRSQFYYDSNDPDLWFGLEPSGGAGNDWDGGFRFPGVQLLTGDQITNAYVRVNSDDTRSTTTVLQRFYAQSDDNPPAFPSTDSSCTQFEARNVTGNSTLWTVPSFSINVWYESPNISLVIQEVIDADTWDSGDAIVILHYNDGSSTGALRNIHSYDQGASVAPNLTIEFELGNGTPTVPTNLTIDGSTDFNVTTSGTVELVCSGSTDPENDTFIYEIEYANDTTSDVDTVLEIRSENDQSTNSGGTSTWVFGTVMSTTGYATIITGLSDSDTVYSTTWVNTPGTTSVNIDIEDDGGASELTDYQAMVIQSGEQTFVGAGFNGEDIEIKCGIHSGSFFSGTITYDTAFPDTNYIVLCDPEDDSDTPICTVNSGSKTAADFDFRIEDDFDSSETITDMSWCAITDAASGGFTINGTVFRTGAFIGGSSTATTMEGTNFSDTDYAVFTQHTDGTGNDPCECEVTPNSVVQFTTTCEDDDDNFCTGRQFDYIAMPEITANLTHTAAVTTRNYTVIGNHSDGGSLAWDTSPYVGEVFEAFQCRVMYPDRSSPSEYFTYESTNLTIEAAGGDSTDPVAVSWLPEDSHNITGDAVNFTVSCTDNVNVSALAVYTNFTGSWVANVTNSTPVNNSNWTVEISGIPEGFYAWAAWCNDTSSNEDYSTNRSIRVDSTGPNNVTGLAEQSVAISWIYWNWTNPGGDWLHTEVWVNGTWKANTTDNFYNLTGLNGTQTWEIQLRPADDLYNLGNWTNDTAVTLDNVSFTIVWNSPTADANHTKNLNQNYKFDVTCVSSTGVCPVNVTIDPPTISGTVIWNKEVSSAADIAATSAQAPIEVDATHQICEDGNGNLWASTKEKQGGSWFHVLMKNSSDNGDSWTTTVQLTGSFSDTATSGSLDCEEETIALGALKENATSKYIFTNVSYDYGDTWASEIVELSDLELSTDPIMTVVVMPDNTSYFMVVDTSDDVHVYRKTEAGSVTAEAVLNPTGTTTAENVAPFRMTVEDEATDIIHIEETLSNGNMNVYTLSVGGAWSGASTIYTGVIAGFNDNFFCTEFGEEMYCAGSQWNFTACFYPYNGTDWQVEKCWNSTGEIPGEQIRGLDAHITANEHGAFYITDTYWSGGNHSTQGWFYNKTSKNISFSNITAWGVDSNDKHYMPRTPRRTYTDNFYLMYNNDSNDAVVLLNLNASLIMNGTQGGIEGGEPGESKGGDIQPCPDTPFCTDTSNPFLINVSDGATETVTFVVNATGTNGSTFEFFATAEHTENASISDVTTSINITIVDSAPAADPCVIVCPHTTSVELNCTTLEITVDGTDNWTIEAKVIAASINGDGICMLDIDTDAGGSLELE